MSSSSYSKIVQFHYPLTMVLTLLFGMFNFGYSRNINFDVFVKGATPLLGGLNINENLGDPIDTLTCMKKVMPCKEYFTSPTAPPSACCDPVKEIVTKDIKCLCDLLNNVDLLKQFNVTQQIAVKLTTACGATIDLNVCKNGAPAAAPAPNSSIPPTTPSNSSSSTDSTTDDSSKKSAATRGMSHFGGFSFGFVAFFLLTLNIVSAFF